MRGQQLDQLAQRGLHFGVTARPHPAIGLIDERSPGTARVRRDSRPLGFAVPRVLGGTGWVYLRYFTVGEKGRGLGEHLWTHLRAAMTGAGHARIVCDVEDLAQRGIDLAEERIRRHRIAFYRRLGAVPLPVHGYLPPEGDAGHPMLLMAADCVPPYPGRGRGLPAPR